MPVCTQPGCPELVPRYGYCDDHRRDRNRKRNADPRRQERYGGSWRRESREVIADHPFCALCSSTSDLTTDHGPNGERTVLCRSCHARTEARRRAAARNA